MSTQTAVSVPTKRLAAAILSTDVSFTLSNILTWKGLVDGTTTLTSADFGTRAFGCFRSPNNQQMELFEFDPTTIASASITILARGLSYSGGTTDAASTKYNWPANSTLVELGAHVPQLFEQYIDKTGDETIAGIKTFSSFPQKSGTTTPTIAGELATKAYVDATATGSAITNQLLIAGTAGETLVAGNLVYFKESDQRWWKTDADAFATTDKIKLGIAQGGATAGVAVNILLSGQDSNQTGLTAGSKYYVGNTAGGISTSPGTLQRFIGWAFSTTSLIFAPDELSENLVFDTAGEILAVGDVVYFKESDGKWWKTDADAAGTSLGVKLGICQLASAADATTIIRIAGIDKTRTSLTLGTKYYLSNTAGALASTAQTLPRFVGVAIGTNELLLDPSISSNVDIYGQAIYAADSVGTDAYAVTLPFAPVGYYAGLTLRFKAGTANTGAATLNVNGLGAINLVTALSTALVTGAIVQNQIVEVIYNSTGPAFQVLNPASMSLGSKSVLGRDTPVTGSAGNVRYTRIVGSDAIQTSEPSGFLVPCAGTIKNLYARSGATLSSTSSTLTIRKNASNTALTVQFTNNTDTTISDTINSFSVVAGDLITASWISVGTSDPILNAMSIEFDATA